MLSSVLIVIGGLSVGFVLQLEPARGRRSHNSILPRRLPPITSPERRESCPQRSASPTSYRPILEAARCGQLSGEKTRQIHPGTLTKYQSRTWKPPTHLAEEAEIFYKELKINMRGGDVLHRHTPETAAQEVAALLMACSIIAEQRLEAGRSGKVDPLSISFIKTLEQMNSLWLVLSVSEGLLDDSTILAMTNRVRDSIVRQATAPRRKRNCPRKIRQPVSSWPRLTVNESNEGDYTFEIISFP
jgi:hypothetical protein